MKRKRTDNAGNPKEVGSAKRQRVEHKLKVDVAKLRHAFKIARGFERQKLGRRSKDAESGKIEKDTKRIEAEIAALKVSGDDLLTVWMDADRMQKLDIDACAQYHLCKNLLKSKAVAQHPDLPPEIKEPSKFASDAATLNVSARLCNSKPVQIALDTAVADVMRALGVKQDDPSALKKKRRRAKDFVNGDQPKGESVTDGQPSTSSTKKAAPEPKQVDSDGDSIESDGYGEFDDRLASDSDDGDERDHDQVAELEAQLAEEGVRDRTASNRPSKYDLEVDLSLSDAESDARSATPEPRKASPSKTRTFIPSLTMGGYVSGSGSDIEDVDVAPKRNRRGQRARQQIWEQKFGSKAKHLQRQDRNSGWDKKRGAVGGNGGRGFERSHRRASPDYGIGGTGKAESTRKTAEPSKTNAQDGPIHPSWQAAKKAKERREAPVAFKGTKTTFD